MLRPAGVVALVLFASLPALGANLAYVRATSQHAAEDSPLYHPLGLLDEDPDTIWCEGAEGLGEGQEVHIFFKQPQKIDRVRIGGTPKSGRIVQQVRVSDGSNTVTLEPGEQYIEKQLSVPMEGKTFTITVTTVGGPNKDAALSTDVACLADVVLYFRNRPWGGQIQRKQLEYDPRLDKLLGRWAGEPLGAPESFITFALDGTWSWSYQPLLGGTARKLAGEYRFRGNRLLMRRGEVGRWADMRFKRDRINVDPDEMGAPRGDYEVIFLNEALGEMLKGEYNNAEF